MVYVPTVAELTKQAELKKTERIKERNRLQDPANYMKETPNETPSKTSKIEGTSSKKSYSRMTDDLTPRNMGNNVETGGENPEQDDEPYKPSDYNPSDKIAPLLTNHGELEQGAGGLFPILGGETNKNHNLNLENMKTPQVSRYHRLKKMNELDPLFKEKAKRGASTGHAHKCKYHDYRHKSPLDTRLTPVNKLHSQLKKKARKLSGKMDPKLRKRRRKMFQNGVEVIEVN